MWHAHLLVYFDLSNINTPFLLSSHLKFSTSHFGAQAKTEQSAMVTFKVEKPNGPACVLSIATDNPPFFVEQKDYAEFLFDACNMNDKVDLRRKFSRICEKSAINKRHYFMTKEILQANPDITTYGAPSLNARLDMLIDAIPKLGASAAEKAIAEWGQYKSKITHVVMTTISGVDMPGADYKIVKLLGLNPDVKRVMLYQQGCFAGGTVMRVAKDLAENNKGARVLVVCSEITASTFEAPSEAHFDGLVGSALFGDGSAAVIVGADPEENEKPLYEVAWAGESVLPDSDGAIEGILREAGLVFRLQRDVPYVISNNIVQALEKGRQAVGSPNVNDMFWVVHPGGPLILDKMAAALGLHKEKLDATYEIMGDVGNMSSASVIFVLDQMRKRSIKMNSKTTGEGCDYGFLLGFGPGLTVETVVLKALPLVV